MEINLKKKQLGASNWKKLQCEIEHIGRIDYFSMSQMIDRSNLIEDTLTLSVLSKFERYHAIWEKADG